jgi:glycosyltransferase involved in cell wall biosynthesis
MNKHLTGYRYSPGSDLQQESLMEHYPLISIITPSYNQAGFLEETIQGVLGQDYPHKEYLVIDGGSSDGSIEIIRRYAQQISYWVSAPDRGQSHAINKGFATAKGEVLAWLNSDDTYMAGALTAVAECFFQHPEVDLIYGNFIYTDFNGKALRRRHVFSSMSYEALLYHDYLGQPAVFFRRSLWEKVGPLDESLHYCMDWELFLRMWKICRPMHLNKVLATYRIHKNAKSNAEHSELYAQEMHLVQQRHINQRFSCAWLNHIWHVYYFYASLALRLWTVLRDNPVDYIRTLKQIYPGKRLVRLLISKMHG